MIKISMDPSLDDLRMWAYDMESLDPTEDFELVLSWGMEPGRVRLCMALAGDPACPRAWFFLAVLYQWVIVAMERDSDTWLGTFQRWLDEAGRVDDPAVKHWRHGARRMFQRVEPFSREAWHAWHAAGEST